MEPTANEAASAEVAAPQTHSLESALGVLNDAEPKAEAPVSEPAAAEEPEAQEASNPEAPETEAEETPDTDPEDLEDVHGNKWTRLRDGTRVRVGDLKKSFDEAREFRAKQAEFDAKRQEFEAKQAQIASQEQHFTQAIAQAKAVLQSNFPPRPDEKLLEQGNTFEYMEQKLRYDAAVQKWQQLDHAQKKAAHEAEQKQQEQAKQQLQREFDLLKDKLPEARSEETFKAFRSDLLEHAPKAYGFSAEDLSVISDHRAFLVLKDAIAYRKLQAEKSKAMEKAKAAPPVQAPQAQPARRVSPAERQAVNVSEAFAKARASGGFASVDDALALLNQMQK
jgi:hypothetical protein